MAVRNEPFRRTSNNPDEMQRPWLQVRLTNPHTGQKLSVWGMIDTGADDCAIPAKFATMLGHNLDKGTAIESNTGNGIATSWLHSTIIEIPDFSTSECLVAYMPNLHVPLLGVRSFLSNFKLEVDYPNKTFSLINPVKLSESSQGKSLKDK